MMVPLMTPRRYAVVVVVIIFVSNRPFEIQKMIDNGSMMQIGLHYFLNTFQEVHSSFSYVDRYVWMSGNNGTRPATPNALSNHDRRANATFVFLCRNSDLEGVVSSIVQIEDRFNKRHGYPWVLLNEEPFTDNFKKFARFGCLFLYFIGVELQTC
jgi:hypothetical protein